MTSLAALLLGLSAVLPAGAAPRETPELVKVDPPSWWPGHSLNPVRLLIRGRNLSDARVESAGAGLRFGAAKVNAAGTALFVDASIEPGAVPGKRMLRVVTAAGAAEAAFEVLSPLPARGRFQGFSPDDVFYLIMPDRFADGDAANDRLPGSEAVTDRSKSRYYHGGDLQGIIDHLPYLKDLGVTVLWMTPIYANTHELYPIPSWSPDHFTDYHGYGPVDYYSVDGHLGDLAKLRELVDKAHAAGMKVVMDQVSNHTGPRHPWVKDPPTPTWYHGTPERHLSESFRTWLLADPYAGPAARRQVMEGWFGGWLPDLNQDDPEMALYMTQNMLWWAGISGADGLRHDVATFIPRTFWRDAMAALKRQYPSFRDVAEINGDPVTIPYFQGGRPGSDGVDTGIDSVFDFTLRKAVREVFLEGRPIEALPAALSADRLYPNPPMLVTTLGLHDDPRFLSRSAPTSDPLKPAWAFLMTTRGIPLIYYGDEIAMRGGDDPDNRLDFPGGWPGDARDAFTRRGRTAEENSAFEHLRRLARLRAGSEPLRRGRLVNLFIGERVYAYARVTDSAWAIVALNGGPRREKAEFECAPVALPAGTRALKDQLGGASAEVKDGRIAVELAPYSAVIFASSRP